MQRHSQLRWLFVLFLACSAAVGIGSARGQLSRPTPPKPPEPLPVVTVVRPVVKEVTDYEDFTGRTEAVETVTVKAHVTGYLTKAMFEEGKAVTKGQELFEIDPRPYQAMLDHAEIMLKKGQAHLQTAETDYKRAEQLFKAKAIAQEDFDRSKAALTEAQEAVEMAKAELRLAELKLGFTKVTAPISGRTGRRLADTGNLVNDGTPLVVIVSQGPTIRASFDIDERTLLRLRKLIREGAIKSYQDAPMKVLLGLSDEEGKFPHQGKVDFMDNAVDPKTGTLRMRGIFENPDLDILPGMFVRIRLPIGNPHKAMLVPQYHLFMKEGQAELYVVNSDNKVETRTIEFGKSHGDLREIKNGLKEEEGIIVTHPSDLIPGMDVVPKEKEATPKK